RFAPTRSGRARNEEARTHPTTASWLAGVVRSLAALAIRLAARPAGPVPLDPAEHALVVLPLLGPEVGRLDDTQAHQERAVAVVALVPVDGQDQPGHRDVTAAAPAEAVHLDAGHGPERGREVLQRQVASGPG